MYNKIVSKISICAVKLAPVTGALDSGGEEAFRVARGPTTHIQTITEWTMKFFKSFTYALLHSV